MKKLPKIINIKLLTGALILTALSFFTLKPILTNAQTQTGQRTFTIIPPTESITTNPGGTKEGVMKIVNDSDEAVTFTISIQDYVVIDTAGTPNLLPPNTLSNKYSASSWIGVDPSIVTVPAHQRKELNYYIQVPIDAKPGGHYAAAVYTPAPGKGASGTGASVNTQLGTLFYINVNGDIKESALIDSFKANMFQEYGPVKILTKIKNLGDLHIKPVGTITITDLLGRKVATLSFPQHNIFPDSIRDYESTFEQKLLIGPFTAKLVASYGKANNLPLVATMTFWVFPWKITLILILVIIAVILATMYWKKNNLRKQEEKVNKENPQG
jgi:hypothetical protein